MRKAEAWLTDSLTTSHHLRLTLPSIYCQTPCLHSCCPALNQA